MWSFGSATAESHNLRGDIKQPQLCLRCRRRAPGSTPAHSQAIPYGRLSCVRGGQGRVNLQDEIPKQLNTGIAQGNGSLSVIIRGLVARPTLIQIKFSKAKFRNLQPHGRLWPPAAVSV
jgi:hypothetical protein